MNVVEKALSSARFNRLIFWAGLVVLAVGAGALVIKFAGGSDRTSANPDKGFKPVLVKKGQPLKNAQGVIVKTYGQLDTPVRSAIRTFIATAVARRHLEKSWDVIAPELKKGYTFNTWKQATALPVVPYPHVDVPGLQYYLDYASTNEILVEVGVSAPEKFHERPTTFQVGLVPVGKGDNKRWLVNYWMPRWTPPLPED
jgi:hypothetical protein